MDTCREQVFVTRNLSTSIQYLPPWPLLKIQTEQASHDVLWVDIFFLFHLKKTDLIHNINEWQPQWLASGYPHPDWLSSFLPLQSSTTTQQPQPPPQQHCWIRLKGTVQRDFWPTSFFIIWTHQGLKYFLFWLRIRQVIQIFQSPQQV